MCDSRGIIPLLLTGALEFVPFGMSSNFPCPICAAEFESPKDLGIHILRSHSKDEEDSKPDVAALRAPDNCQKPAAAAVAPTNQLDVSDR